MLILTRKEGDQIRIHDDILVKVVAVDGGRVKLGVTAPRSITVDREEIRAKRLERQIRHPAPGTEVSDTLDSNDE